MNHSQDKEEVPCDFCPDNFSESKWFGKNACWKCCQSVYRVIESFAVKAERGEPVKKTT